jgi:hypothetical protein
LSVVTAGLAIVPLFEPALRRPADLAAATSVGLGILLLLALVFVSEKK